MNGKEVVERALSLGEAVHGSEKEKAILKLIEESLDREVKRVPVRTKVSSALSSEVRASGTMISRSGGGFPTRRAGRQSWGNSAGLRGPRRYPLLGLLVAASRDAKIERLKAMYKTGQITYT